MGSLIDNKAAAEMLRKLADRFEKEPLFLEIRVIDHQEYSYSTEEVLTVKWRKAR